MISNGIGATREGSYAGNVRCARAKLRTRLHERIGGKHTHTKNAQLSAKGVEAGIGQIYNLPQHRDLVKGNAQLRAPRHTQIRWHLTTGSHVSHAGDEKMRVIGRSKNLSWLLKSTDRRRNKLRSAPSRLVNISQLVRSMSSVSLVKLATKA